MGSALAFRGSSSDFIDSVCVARMPVMKNLLT